MTSRHARPRGQVDDGRSERSDDDVVAAEHDDDVRDLAELR